MSGEPPGPGSWLRERVWLLDLLVVIGVFLYNVPIIPTYADDAMTGIGLIIVSAALCAPYMLRRRYPLAVFGIMLVAACVQLLFSAPILVADVMLLFAVYNVATGYRWWASLTVALLAVGWLLVAAIPHLGDEFLEIGQLGVLVVVTLWVWTWGTLVRIRRQYIAGLRERAEQAERERETNARIAVADERARIAREIHDIVSHSLSVVVVMSDGAAAKVESEPERAKSAMLGVLDTGRTALAEMRRMLGVLRDDEPGSQAPQPGITQLEDLIEQSRAAGMPVALTVSGERPPLSQGVELTVYRVVQEALTNVRKHAGSQVTGVDMALTYRPEEVEVRVADDGRGPTDDVGGHGLVGMRERTAAHGGTFQAGARVGGGFELVAVLPREGEGA
ncbi:sensor histidine kinase [Nesterenkonia aerolata]|uniref:histidine kinase n=1 Tax=Nesterenkonia aerolata TaxID=3074079 RepID=A0ABU2DU71_9MICC|nr:histidine kinase [Nesterenkonia sp. LY-0111]MDR8020043.1 histidine kinase [Nesterenkonia sp. LY-0111]